MVFGRSTGLGMQHRKTCIRTCIGKLYGNW